MPAYAERCIFFIMTVAMAGFAAAAAGAPAQRTFVASYGLSTNISFNCSRSNPCRQFGEAIGVTASGGEVLVLDSAGYGIVTITSAISIIAPPGVYAGISVFPGQDGVTVSAGALDKVVLRGLTINGQNGDRGILITSGRETHIEDCTVSNLSDNGIQIDGGAKVYVVRTTVRSNLGFGIRVVPTSVAPVTLVVVDSLLTDNLYNGLGIATTVSGGTVYATATRVTSSGNGSAGFLANSINLGTIAMFISDSTAVENGTNGAPGVYADGTNTTVIVTASTIARNQNADLYQAGGAVLRTSGNNTLTGRGAADVIGTLTSNPLK